MGVARPHRVVLTVAALVVVGLAVLLPGWTAGSVGTIRAALPSILPSLGPPPAESPGLASPVPEPNVLGITALLTGVDAPDPFMVVEAGQPWLFTTNTFEGNVPVITSTPEGVRWVADALPHLPPWAKPGFTWSPTVMPTDDGWVLAFTALDRSSGRQCIGVAQSPVLAGPYAPATAPLVCDVARGGSIDPSFVVDDTGQRWLLYKDDGNCCGLPTTLRSVPLTPDGLALAGLATDVLRADLGWEDGVIEAPTMTQVGDRWLLLYSASRWDHAGYAVGAAWCSSPAGPCMKQLLPALSSASGLNGPGGVELITGAVPDGKLVVAFHAWPDGAHAYTDGSIRRLHLGDVSIDASNNVTIVPVATPAPG